MKIPKVMKRYCPKCKKRTEQKVKEQSSGRPSTLKRGAKQRARLRGLNRGRRKTTKKTALVYTCTICGKSKDQKKGKRTSKLILE